MDREIILKALQSQYQGEMDIALANIEVYRSNPSGIGEHPEVSQSVDSQIQIFANSKEKWDAVEFILGNNNQKTLVE